MVTVTASLKTGKIISVVDHGPRPGDETFDKVLVDLIVTRIRKESQA